MIPVRQVDDRDSALMHPVGPYLKKEKVRRMAVCAECKEALGKYC